MSSDKTAAKKKDLTAVKQYELQLYNKWLEGGKQPEDMRPLLKSVQPLIRGKSNFWAKRVDLPEATVRSAFTDQFVKALETYDPNRGASLSTWVTTNLKKSPRWLIERSGVTRTQESRFYSVGQYQSAKSYLSDELGREPTSFELADHLGWAESTVEKLEAETQGVQFSSGLDMYDPMTIQPSRSAEIARLIRPELSAEELLVFDYQVGWGGKPRLIPGQIAKQMGLSPSKVSNLRNAVIAKIKKYE